MGNDGKFSLGAYKRLRLPHEPSPICMSVRAYRSSAVSKANAVMVRNLSVFVSLFLIGLLLAWFIGKHVVVNPL